MTQPIVSIIMPAFNAEVYISQAIESVINQTYLNWELIVVDNHSSDETSQIIDGYKDVRIKHLYIDNQGVIAKSRNLGIASAVGPLIAFLDADDYWHPEKISRFLGAVPVDGELLYSDAIVISAQDFKLTNLTCRYVSRNALRDLLMNGNPIVNSSVMVERRFLVAIGMFDESRELAGIEDYNAWLRLAELGVRFRKLEGFLTFYRIHENSFSAKSNEPGIRRAAFKGLRQAISDNRLKQIESRHYEIQGRTAIHNKDFRNAIAFLKHAKAGALFPAILRINCLLIVVRSIDRILS